MIVNIRDIDWQWHTFDNIIEADDYMLSNMDKYNYVYTCAYYNHIELIAIEREEIK